jgi:hypothetical protein
MEINMWNDSAVEKAVFDEVTGAWSVEVTRGGGEKVTLKPTQLVIACGTLSSGRCGHSQLPPTGSHRNSLYNEHRCCPYASPSSKATSLRAVLPRAGMSGFPNMPKFDNQDSFKGTVCHSSSTLDEPMVRARPGRLSTIIVSHRVNQFCMAFLYGRTCT